MDPALDEIRTIHIGFDDTDSINGKCTTHLAFKITSYLFYERHVQFIDYPLLVRLNPNIPWKTRGNASVCLRIRSDYIPEIVEYIKNTISTQSAEDRNTNPGLAVLESNVIPNQIKQFTTKAMYDVLSVEEAEELAIKNNISYLKFGNGRGIIGALAAIGCTLEGDHTYEAIAYRKNCSKGVRNLDRKKIIKYNYQYFPFTFNNFDPSNNRILVAPHGPDPIYCGIRGESPYHVVTYLMKILHQANIEGFMVFRTNQATNMHLIKKRSLSSVNPHTAGYAKCFVSKNPKIIKGGHVFFEISDNDGFKSVAAVYEPTGMGKIAARLEVGDIIDIGFGVTKVSNSQHSVLNIEYISIEYLTSKFTLENPKCLNCNKRMKSEGKNKGFQCEVCKSKSNSIKIKVPVPRDLCKGIYMPKLTAFRHLTKPLHRYGLEKTYLTIPNFSRPIYSNWIQLFKPKKDSGGLI